MSRLVWDAPGSRVFETGLDRGVLYIPDLQKGVVWNGLVSFTERQGDAKTEPLYFNGFKYLDFQKFGTFTGTLEAFTYPDEFNTCLGLVPLRGMILTAQNVQHTFSLSFRTRIGNDLLGTEYAYQIHVIYNLIADQESRTLGTISNSTEAETFAWNIEGIPLTSTGLGPTNHVIFDTRYLTSSMVAGLESFLYDEPVTGSGPQLPSLQRLLDYISDWHQLTIYDNGDGTWFAIDDGTLITLPSEYDFVVDAPYASYQDEVTYRVSNDALTPGTHTLRITNNGDGTWTAIDNDGTFISLISSDTFEIEAIPIDETTYQASDFDT
jgi:hypothetical protein